MGKVINIQPVTRIEGHAKVAITLDDAGNVTDTKVHVQALRGFEKFCEGRPVEEMPRIVCHICGICPWAHHLASSKAADACLGVTPPPAAVKLRRLMQSIAYVSDKILHFYFLAAPDFVIGPDADYSVRNVVGIIQAAPDIAKKVVQMRHMGAQMLEHFAGRAIHPTFSQAGGVSKPMTETERKEMLPLANELLEFSKFSINFAKENVFPKYLDAIKSIGVIKVGYMGTVTDDGALDFYDGKLRLMKPDGTYDDFAYDQYVDYIGEWVEPWSYQKFPYAKKWGKLDMSLDNPVGVYRTNCLARINVADKMKTPLAQAELEEFRAAFGRPAHLHPAVPLRPPHRTGAGGGDRGAALERPGDHQPGHPGEGRTQGRPGHRLRGSPPGHPDPRLHLRRQRPDHQRQPDRGHHPQQRRHQHVGEPGGQDVHQGRQV